MRLTGKTMASKKRRGVFFKAIKKESVIFLRSCFFQLMTDIVFPARFDVDTAPGFHWIIFTCKVFDQLDGLFTAGRISNPLGIGKIYSCPAP
jgi:hypothetical protein